MLKRPWTKTFLGIGSNEGSQQKNLFTAIHLLSLEPEMRHLVLSPIYRTEPVGGPPQSDYHNAVVQMETRLSPSALLRVLKRIERFAGRRPAKLWGPRVIDLDILAYGQSRYLSKELRIPHPRYAQRRFVLIPFCDLAPYYVHPVLRKTNRTLLRCLTPLGQRVTIAGAWRKPRFYPSKRKRSLEFPSLP